MKPAPMVKPTNVENLVIIADVLNCSIQDFCVFGVSLRVKDRVNDKIIAYRAISNGENSKKGHLHVG